MSKQPFTKAEFDAIFSRVPRLTVELIIMTPEGLLLTKRTIDPGKGQWHFPGGTVYFGEFLTDAVKRVAEDELGLKVEPISPIGFIEYPHAKKEGYKGWPVGIAFETRITGGQLRIDSQAEEIGFFLDTPKNTLKDQAIFLNKSVFKKQ